jgi:hypothetical protein
MQFKSLFLGAAGIAAVTALSGCSTGSVKGEFKAPYSVSSTVGVGGAYPAPTELKVDIDAKVNFPFEDFNTPNASGEVKIKDENLDLEFEGKIYNGMIEGSQTDEIRGLTFFINELHIRNINYIVPPFDFLLAEYGSSSTLVSAGFLGKLEGEDDDDNDDDSNNTSNDDFVIILVDFPTIDVAQLVGGNAKPVTKFVHFATFDAISSDLTFTNTHYVASGFGNKGKLKWNIVPPVN